MLATKTSRFTIMGVALLFAIGMFSSVHAKTQSFTTINVPGAIATEANGINVQGDIVGFYYSATGDILNTVRFHGFLLSKGVFTTIDVPGAGQTGARGINPQGDIVGSYENATGGHGFLLSK
jgi:uncharacterized membrane protein